MARGFMPCCVSFTKHHNYHILMICTPAYGPDFELAGIQARTGGGYLSCTRSLRASSAWSELPSGSYSLPESEPRSGSDSDSRTAFEVLLRLFTTGRGSLSSESLGPSFASDVGGMFSSRLLSAAGAWQFSRLFLSAKREGESRNPRHRSANFSKH